MSKKAGRVGLMDREGLKLIVDLNIGKRESVANWYKFPCSFTVSKVLSMWTAPACQSQCLHFLFFLFVIRSFLFILKL